MNSEFGYRARLLSILIGIMTGFLSLLPQSRAAEAGHYNSLQPDVFLKSWLVLKSIPIPRNGEKPPSDEAQRVVFARDLLSRAGGETGTKPASGSAITIDGKRLEWRAVESREDTIDLHDGSDPTEFAVAYAWEEIGVKRHQGPRLARSTPALTAWRRQVIALKSC